MHLEAEVYIFCVSYVSNFHILVIKSMYWEKINGKYHVKKTVYAHCCFVVCFIKGTISQDFQYFFNLTFKSVRKILNQSLKIRITNFFTKFLLITFCTTNLYSLFFAQQNSIHYFFAQQISFHSFFAQQSLESLPFCTQKLLLISFV